MASTEELLVLLGFILALVILGGIIDAFNGFEDPDNGCTCDNCGGCRERCDEAKMMGYHCRLGKCSCVRVKK